MYDDLEQNQIPRSYADRQRTGESTYGYGAGNGEDAGMYRQSTPGGSNGVNGYSRMGQSSGREFYHNEKERASETVMPPKKSGKKNGAAGKFFGILFSGLLFGVCAGFALIAVLKLFPDKVVDKGYLGHKPPVSIENTEPVEPGAEASDGRVTEGKPVSKDQGEAAEKQDGAGTDQKAEGSMDDTEGGASEDSAENPEKPEETAADPAEDAAKVPETVVTDVTKVVDAVMPSVVSIFGTYEVTENYWGFEMQRREDGSGSGIIVGENDEELLIVTNNHVVADSTALSVQFIDSETCSAQVKGTDADSDLAVIAVRMVEIKDSTREQIRIATLGDSDKLKVGEPAIAIGNALGYGQSVTTGVISALNRTYSQDEQGNSTELIQTDAAINPGNSGGALLNIYGEVIGINSSKLGGMVIEGMGYAIPISTARPILEELMNKKTRTPLDDGQKGYLGISGINVTEDVRDTYGLPIGVYIAQVFDGTPAQRVGLKKGDIIISFDGESVKTMEELSKLLDMTPAGTQVELVIMSSQGGEYQEETISVVLDAQYR